MSNTSTVQVWDLLIRIFHWSLLICFIIAYLTSEEENIWHIYSGYAVLGLIVFRLIWGLIGTRYARFNNFIYPPAAVFTYLKELLNRTPRHYAGHNPAGGWMIIALLISLFLVTISGLQLYAIEEGLGPLAGNTGSLTIIENANASSHEEEDDDDEHGYEVGEQVSSGHSLTRTTHEQEEEFWEEFHEVTTNITLLLILLHVAGVFVSGHLHHENLVKAMITGNKTPPEQN